MRKFATAAVLVLASAAAQASSTTYSDFISWSDDVAGIVTTDTFNSYAFNTNPGGYTDYGTGATLGGIQYNVPNGIQFFGIAKSLNYDAAYHGSNYLEWQSGTSPLTISLSGQTKAIAFNFGEFYGSAANYTVTLGNGDSFTLTGAANQYSFFGVISTVAFGSLKIAADTQFPSIDNLSLGPVNPVPEPEGFAMLLAGLGVMGTIARRRQRR